MKSLLKKVKRSEVEKKLQELDSKLENKEYEMFFYKELKKEKINKQDFKIHFYKNKWLFPIIDNIYYGELMVSSGATKEWIDFYWLDYFMKKIEYKIKNS